MNQTPLKPSDSRSHRHPQAGFSLIEILVTMIVLAFGLLGLASLQNTGLRGSHSAYLTGQATILAYDMFDRLRANRDSALAGDYDIAVAADAPTGATTAEQDLADWLGLVTQTLPLGDGAIARAGNVVTITVQWDDDRDGVAEPLSISARL